MYHLVNNLTNKSGDALVGYFVKLKDADGNYATLYSDTNSTPIATVSGVANAGITDSTGMYDIYVADGTYDVEFFDKNDITQLLTRIPAVPMFSNTSVEAATEATLAELGSTDTGKGASLVSLEDGTDLEAAVAARATTADLASTASGKGAAMVGFKQAGTGAVARTLDAKSRDVVSAKDFGAVGDGATVDTTSLQSLIDAVGQYGGDLGKTGYLPTGLYPLDATLVPSSRSRLSGEGPRASVLRNDVITIPTIPAFTKAGPLAYVSLENLGARGQKSILDVAGQAEDLMLSDLWGEGLAESGLHFRNALYTSHFDRIVIESAWDGVSVTRATPKGLIVDGLANNNRVNALQLKNLTDHGITLNGSEDMVFASLRNEGGFAPVVGKAMLNLAAGFNHVRFEGGYFEGAQEYLVKASGGATGMVTFDGSHFTYYTAGIPYKFDSASVVCCFRQCHATIPHYVPHGSVVDGYNVNLTVIETGTMFTRLDQRGGHAIFKRVKGTAASLQGDFLKFTRPSSATTYANQQQVAGTLTVMVNGVTGGFPQIITRKYLIAIDGKAGGGSLYPVTVNQVTQDTVDTTGGGITISVSGVSGSNTEITLRVAVAGLTNGTESILSGSFEWISHAYNQGEEFVVEAL